MNAVTSSGSVVSLGMVEVLSQGKWGLGEGGVGAGMGRRLFDAGS